MRFSFQLNKLKDAFYALGDILCMRIPILLTITVFLVALAIMIRKQAIKIKCDKPFFIVLLPSLPYLTVSIFFFLALLLHVLNLKSYPLYF